MSVAVPDLTTPRLELRPVTVSLIDAILEHDVPRIRALTGAEVPPASAIPPLMDDALPYMRTWLVERDLEATWLWYATDRTTARMVGMAGLGLGVTEEGAAFLGYAVYPEHEGRGYATEIARTLVQWALRQPDVRSVEATIPPWHAASRRVADHAGLVVHGTAHDDEVGEVLVYRVDRDGSARGSDSRSGAAR